MMNADTDSKTFFGFWVYLMSDCILFATLFATYAVLHKGTFGGPSGKELFNLPYALVETFLLLISSFTSGLAMMKIGPENKHRVLGWFFVTFLLGAGFVGMEINEFYHMIQEGNGPARSGFLTSFFTLVGTHGFHVSMGLIWMVIFMAQAFCQGLTPVILRRFVCLKLFWHFLDVVWIFIFTFVYLMGVLG